MAKISEQDPNIIICDNGSRRRRNPFAATLTPHQLCGEVSLPEPLPSKTEEEAVDEMFYEIFGDLPFPGGSRQGVSERGANNRWTRHKNRYQGVVVGSHFEDETLENFEYFGPHGEPVVFKYRDQLRVAFPFEEDNPPMLGRLTSWVGYPHHMISSWQIQTNRKLGICPKNIHPYARRTLRSCIPVSEQDLGGITDASVVG